jgi:hypothetical protein
VRCDNLENMTFFSAATSVVDITQLNPSSAHIPIPSPPPTPIPTVILNGARYGIDSSLVHVAPSITPSFSSSSSSSSPRIPLSRSTSHLWTSPSSSSSSISSSTQSVLDPLRRTLNTYSTISNRV